MKMGEINSVLPPQEVSIEVLQEKYAKGNETEIDQVCRRVALSLASVEVEPKMEAHFYQALKAGFVPAGRIWSAAGAGIKATLINCFVQPMSDSISDEEEGAPGIYDALKFAAETMRRGGGVGYDFSPIRPMDAKVKGTQSSASGPLSYMNVFDASCVTVESAGSRRGAQMGALIISHPDIERFIHAKRDYMLMPDGVTRVGKLTNFNMSVGVTDAFMEAVINDEDWQLTHAAEPNFPTVQLENGEWLYKTVRAVDLWEQIMRSTYNHGEPGILFLDRINKDNNLHYCETIRTTNPCGEQPLPPYGCCDLGSVNLTMFVRKAFTTKAYFDFEAFKKLIPTAVRMLDDVLDVTVWPLEQQRMEAMNKRRIGLGFLGLGSACAMLGLRYDRDEGRAFASKVSEVMRDAAYNASVDLAIEKMPFPAFDVEKYFSGESFATRLPEDIKARIRKHGIRNSHLLSIAPTGTITLAFADNASNGIEPPFSLTYERKKRMSDGSHKTYSVEDSAYRLFRHMNGPDAPLPESFVTALEMTALDHLEMVKAVAPFIDTSISKTVNIPAEYPYDDFKELYLEAWRGNLKGLATYRPNATLGSVLSVKTEDKREEATPEAAEVLAECDPMRKQIERRPEGDLNSITRKVSYSCANGDVTYYASVSFATVDGVLNGVPVKIQRPIEFFLMGDATEGQQWITALMRQLSMLARYGGNIAKSLADLRKVSWDKGYVSFGSYTKLDGSKVPLRHTSECAVLGYALQQILINVGFLDADGNQVPTKVLARIGEPVSLEEVNRSDDVPAEIHQPGVTGHSCPKCYMPTLVKRDGCKHCESCGYEGSCG
jgi:ribonucleoside-diphosphate reductase alpha chain